MQIDDLGQPPLMDNPILEDFDTYRHIQYPYWFTDSCMWPCLGSCYVLSWWFVRRFHHRWFHHGLQQHAVHDAVEDQTSVRWCQCQLCCSYSLVFTMTRCCYSLYSPTKLNNNDKVLQQITMISNDQANSNREFPCIVTMIGNEQEFSTKAKLKKRLQPSSSTHTEDGFQVANTISRTQVVGCMRWKGWKKTWQQSNDLNNRNPSAMNSSARSKRSTPPS